MTARSKKSTDEPTRADPVQGEVIATSSVAELVEAAEPPAEQSTVLGPLIGGISTQHLKAALEVQTEQRQLIAQFIRDHLVDGTDFGRIHVVNKDKCKALANYQDCTFDGHYSKRVLFKPGQEKLFSLFQITDTLERDAETYEMLSDVKNLVAYKCTLYRMGQVIGHGRGSATVGDNRRDANATIKIAEKRARMDACLSLGFSEYFTQDLDDPDYKAQAEMANERARQQAEVEEAKRRAGPVTNETRQNLFRWLTKRSIKNEDMVRVMTLNGISDPSEMTEGQAYDLCAKLANNVFANVPQATADVPDMSYPDPVSEPELPPIDPDEIAAATGAPAIQPDPQLVIDEDFKSNTYMRFKGFAFNSRGEMMFKTKACGKPYLPWENFEDKHWRKAYALIEAIEDQQVNIDDKYLLGVETLNDDKKASANDDLVATARSINFDE